MEYYESATIVHEWNNGWSHWSFIVGENNALSKCDKLDWALSNTVTIYFYPEKYDEIS